MKTYKIIRHYKKLNKGTRTIAKGLTLEEAKLHCNREDTRKEGVWFDGYTSE